MTRTAVRSGKPAGSGSAGCFSQRDQNSRRGSRGGGFENRASWPGFRAASVHFRAPCINPASPGELPSGFRRGNKAPAEVRRYRDTVHAGRIGNLTNGFLCIEVDHIDLRSVHKDGAQKGGARKRRMRRG